MADVANGSTSSLSYIVETTPGVTPAGNFTPLPYSNSHSLNLSKERLESAEMHSDRMSRIDRHGNRSAGGEIPVELRPDVYDDWLEAVMLGTWDTSVSGPDELKMGNTLKTFSVEDYDATIDYARLFTAITPTTTSFSLGTNQMFNTTFNCVGYNATNPDQSEKTQNPEVIREPFDGYSGAFTIGDSGGSLSSNNLATSLEWTVEQEINPLYAIGSDEPVCFDKGMAKVEGNLSFYYKDADLITRFLNEVETAIKVTVNNSSGADEYGFFFPRVKFNGADVPVEGQGARIITVPFVALYDTTEQSNLIITRPETV